MITSLVRLFFACFFIFSVGRLARGAEEPNVGNSAIDSYRLGRNFSAVEPFRQAAVLRELSEKIRRNREAVRTWSGTFRFHDEAVISGGQAKRLFKPVTLAKLGLTPPFVKDDKCSGSFFVDAIANSFFVELRSDSRRVREQHGQGFKELEGPPFRQLSIVTPEHYLHIRPDELYGDFEIAPNGRLGQTRAVFRDPTAIAEGEQWGCVIDPRRLFDCERAFHAEFEVYAKAVERGGESGDTIRIKEWATDRGLRYRIEVSGGPAGEEIPKVEMWTTVAEEAGFNPVQLEVLVDGNGTQYMSWQFQENNGVFVPVEVLRMVGTADGKAIGFQRAISIQGSKLNEAIPEPGFSIAALELKDGERLLDRIEQKLFLVEGGGLRRIDNVPAMRATLDRPAMGLLVFVNFLVICVILLLVFMKRSNPVLRFLIRRRSW